MTLEVFALGWLNLLGWLTIESCATRLAASGNHSCKLNLSCACCCNSAITASFSAFFTRSFNQSSLRSFKKASIFVVILPPRTFYIPFLFIQNNQTEMFRIYERSEERRVGK